MAKIDTTERITRRTSYKPILFALLMTAVAGGIGYYAWNLRTDHQAVKASLKEAQKDQAALAEERDKTSKLEQQIATCATERDAAQKQVSAMEGNLQASQAELIALRKQREETSKRLEAFKKLTQSFQRMIDSGQLDVVVRQGRMMVRLPAEVLFDSGSAELSRAGELALMEVAVGLRQFSDRSFMVAGHTDNRPLEASESSKYRNNWELSTARAVTVTGFLIEAKLPPENLVAAGYGPYDPVGDNRTSKGRQENRRIEIVLLPTIDELPKIPDVIRDSVK